MIHDKRPKEIWCHAIVAMDNPVPGIDDRPCVGQLEIGIDL
ncbi:hypothetical protein [Parabacteroides distasonis]